eukprot:TRINITY_DN43458_c0_g1_i1.p1 TRINITY_DN43458_c0_g1~~TRINITY_DN43458_c0_g1_i1.p1  ORF type:complete len:600 (-),score=68.10 TRINITY_DN43458_c0_g1_i1:143-1942(-)
MSSGPASLSAFASPGLKDMRTAMSSGPGGLSAFLSPSTARALTRRYSSDFTSPIVPLMAEVEMSEEEDEEDVDAEEVGAKFATRRPQLTHEELLAVILVYLINFIDSLGQNISQPTMPFYAKMFGASTTEIGYLFSFFSISTTLSLPLLSKVSDRSGRKVVMILSLLGTSFGALCQGFATSYNMLLAARVFSGIWAGVSSVCQVYICDTVPSALRPWYVSYLVTSSQAALLFGPSIGAGLSVLGLNVPILTTSAVSLTLVPIVWYYLPESAEWVHLQEIRQARFSRNVVRQGSKNSVYSSKEHADNRWGTKWAIAIYGMANFAGMVAQSSFASMYAIFAAYEFHLDPLHVGFILTLGAIASVGANIWISPSLQDAIGDVRAGVAGSIMVLFGATILAVASDLRISLLGLLILFMGVAINNAAVSCGASDLTDTENRSTVMTGVRVFKSIGAVAGPSFAGLAASHAVWQPFVVVGCFAIFGASFQYATWGLNMKVREIVHARKAIAKSNKELWKEYDGNFQKEIGTPVEIRELGEFMAVLLTEHNYRWVTYNKELRVLLKEFFPKLSTASPEAMNENFKWLKDQASNLKRQADTWTPALH